MEGLRDIHSIDPAPWWPPGPGWWLLLLGLLLAGLLSWWWWHQRRLYPLGRWQRDARRQLLQLRRKLHSHTGKEVAAELSELLRRIAITRCGRKNTAALSGQRWLLWLQQNDPSGFDWPGQGALLLHLPYAPPGKSVDQDAIRRLIDAALRWLSSEEACRV
ncbi:DUF4381 domain-containing protein [endosymbiont of Ridgeia piscesae]|jgi:hypothetical protein|uniref:DUF4381 domain-containing protein n=1 Tax=endosymbiont of Ridgeia piscesae TaxID=54398 RepID=A0A0T5Z8J5_9GAMM|nr:DUF4381 domain-containing protein [endosymbiont of Ridgeia piscesae]KRT54689.1 protein of unknown function (DUF4381) [endosymbiont of Ridgeia piscesae]KRT59223.1 protein of unknown function (DUF4381) [endosymbiont of Ridgeia piscesae]